MGCSPPGSSVRGILQARVLEWGAVAFSRRVLWSSDYRNRSQSASTTFPELQRADSRGKGRKTRENSQEKAQRRLGRGPGSRQGTRRSAPGRFCRQTPSRWAESPRNQWRAAHRLQSAAQRDLQVAMLPPSLTSPPAHQKNAHELITASLNLDCEPSHCTILSERDTQCFEAGGRRVPLSRQSNNAPLFDLTQRPVSEIPFGIGV